MSCRMRSRCLCMCGGMSPEGARPVVRGPCRVRSLRAPLPIQYPTCPRVSFWLACCPHYGMLLSVYFFSPAHSRYEVHEDVSRGREHLRAVGHTVLTHHATPLPTRRCQVHGSAHTLNTHHRRDTQLHGFCPAPALMRTLGELGLQRRSSVQRRSPIEVHSCLPELRC